MKRVVLVTSPLTSGHAVRGVGFYTKNLLENLKLQAPKHNIEIVENGKGDLIHYPFFDLFKNTLPIIKKNKTIVTIHDLIPLEFPEIYKPGLRGSINLSLQKLSLNQADRVITDSMASLKSIRKYLGVPHKKLNLVYLAADKKFKKLQKPKNKYDLPSKFVLFVGDVNYNKNIPNLIAACKIANFTLVIVGKQAVNIENLDTTHSELKHLKDLDLNSVIRLGFVPDEDLVDIYNLATVYCQPSLAEGFGLPVLEALACGTNVACSNTSSLPEVGGEAVTYFNPLDTLEMAEAIKNAKSKNPLEQAAKFSWEKTALWTLQVYEDVLSS